jgi:hypothetical protein
MNFSCIWRRGKNKTHFGNTKATIGPKELKSFVLSFQTYPIFQTVITYKFPTKNVPNVLNINYLQISSLPVVLQCKVHVHAIKKHGMILVPSCNLVDITIYCVCKGAFTLGVRDLSVESPNTMLVIYNLHLP